MSNEQFYVVNELGNAFRRFDTREAAEDYIGNRPELSIRVERIPQGRHQRSRLNGGR